MILNATLIFGLLGAPRMGVAGAALATVLARLVEVQWCVREVARRGKVKLRAKLIAARDPVLRADFWKYTAPVLGNETVWGVGFTMYSVIMGHLGRDAVAANAIAGIFCAGGDSRFGLCCDAVTMWCVTVPLGFLAAFALRLPVPAVYFIISLDEMIKLPAAGPAL